MLTLSVYVEHNKVRILDDKVVHKKLRILRVARSISTHTVCCEVTLGCARSISRQPPHGHQDQKEANKADGCHLCCGIYASSLMRSQESSGVDGH